MKMADSVNSEGLTMALEHSISLRCTGKPPAPAPRVRKFSPFKVICQFVALFVLAYGSYMALTHFVLQSVEVVGNSMVPTLQNTEHCLLNRWVFMVREPQTQDIVVLRDPTDKTYAVKRIIAREGDSVYLKDGKVYVNGKLLDEPYLAKGTATYACPEKNEQWILCGKGQYIVLGDNRNNSLDSRVYGSVPRQDILGVIIH